MTVEVRFEFEINPSLLHRRSYTPSEKYLCCSFLNQKLEWQFRAIWFEGENQDYGCSIWLCAASPFPDFLKRNSTYSLEVRDCEALLTDKSKVYSTEVWHEHLLYIHGQEKDKISPKYRASLQVSIAIQLANVPYATVSSSPGLGIQSLYNEKASSDVEIQCGHLTVNVHKNILAAHSETLRKAFSFTVTPSTAGTLETAEKPATPGMPATPGTPATPRTLATAGTAKSKGIATEATTSTSAGAVATAGCPQQQGQVYKIDETRVKPHVLKIILQWMYMFNIKDLSYTNDILEAAEYLQMSRLKDTCQLMLMDELDMANCLQSLNTGYKYNLKELQRKSCEVYMKHKSEVLEVTRNVETIVKDVPDEVQDILGLKTGN
jgi:hypothetical protein